MRGVGKSIKDERLKFRKGLQRMFLRKIKKKSGLTWQSLAKGMGVCEHTLMWDWQSEKMTIPKTVAQELFRKYPFEKWNVIKKYWIEKILSKNWGQEKSGDQNEKTIKIPNKDEYLAEILGIILGDGHLERKTLTITGNSYEINHHFYFAKLIKKLFGLNTCTFKLKNANCIQSKVYSTKFIEFLIENGMVSGNKISNGAALPKWIFKNKKFIFGALRGLIDTDGGIYFKQKKYKRAFIEFQTKSPYIRSNLISLIKGAGLSPSKSSNNVRIQNQNEVKEFFKLIGSSNPKNIIRYKYFIEDNFIPLKERFNENVLNVKINKPFKAALV